MDKITHLENTQAGVKADAILEVMMRNTGKYKTLNVDINESSGLASFFAQMHTSRQWGASVFDILIDRFQGVESKFGFVKKIQTEGVAGLGEIIQNLAAMNGRTNPKNIRDTSGGYNSCIAK